MFYAEFVDRLKNGHKFEETCGQVPPEALIDLGLAPVIAACDELDGAKKKLFCDACNPKNVFEHVADFTREDPPLSYDVVNNDTLHAIVGACTKASKLAKELQEALEQRRAIDRDRLISEAGDVLWYIQMIANSLDVTLADLIAANVEKLRNANGSQPDVPVEEGNCAS